MSQPIAWSPSRRLRGALASLVFLFGAACGNSITPHTALPIGGVAPGFSLPDVNPASTTFATNVAPSQYVGSASAWYFGHAT